MGGKGHKKASFLKYILLPGGAILTVLFMIGDKVEFVWKGGLQQGTIELIGAGVLITGFGWVARNAIRKKIE